MTRSETFAERVRTARIRQKLNQGELSSRSGVGRRTLVRWESGNLTGIDLENIVAVADTLGVSTDYLLGREDDADASIGININQRWNQLFRLQLQRVETAIDAGADTDLVKKLNMLERHELAKILPHEDYRSMMISKGGSQ